MAMEIDHGIELRHVKLSRGFNHEVQKILVAALMRHGVKEHKNPGVWLFYSLN
jgi:hypothetical protein